MAGPSGLSPSRKGEQMNAKQLAGRTAIVTGASRGFGRSIATALAEAAVGIGIEVLDGAGSRARSPGERAAARDCQIVS